jgi:hypothetical protein
MFDLEHLDEISTKEEFSSTLKSFKEEIQKIKQELQELEEMGKSSGMIVNYGPPNHNW